MEIDFNNNASGLSKNGLNDAYGIENGLENGLEEITVESNDIKELCKDCNIDSKIRYDEWGKAELYYVKDFCDSCITFIKESDFWKKVKANPNYEYLIEYYENKWSYNRRVR
jgi:hypothetical protein